jgi:hypothetical protein
LKATPELGQLLRPDQRIARDLIVDGGHQARPAAARRSSRRARRVIGALEGEVRDLGHSIRRVTMNDLRGPARKVELVAAL